MSSSESFEDHTTIEPAQQPTVTTSPAAAACSLVDGFSNTPALDTQASTSLWTYLRWILWAIFSGFIHCGRALTLFPFDEGKAPSGVARERTIDAELHSDCELQYVTPPPLDSATVSVVVNETVSWDICDPSSIQSSSPVLSQTTSIIELATDDSPKASIETVPRGFPSLPEYCDPWNLPSGFLPEPSSFDSPTFTLLSSLYANSTNGLIDTVTFENTVDEIVQSVIPRNLSDCSEVTVCPEIRKMYAWNKLPMDCLNDNDKSNDKGSFDTKSGLCDSDRQLAYPGRLTMSEAVSPSLSPSTLDSSTTLGESPCAAHRNSDMAFSFGDGKHQALTWAMENLTIEGKKDNGFDIFASQNQTLPSGSQVRQSRDKSPVSTVNSLRPPDQLGSSYFALSGVCPLPEKSNSFSETPPKPKRSSSLKSQRTPPGTPEPKSVRFADALGLDLETVRHVFDQEIPPKIPASATFDLELDSDESIAKLGAKQFGLCFAQPGLASNFIRRVIGQNVCLEDAHVGLPRGVLTGTIRVRSLGFEKRVIIRITYNNWATFCDIPASYVQGSHDGTTDKFAFSVVFPDTMVPGDRAQFALRYEAHTGEQFWDNNHGQNYSVACYAKATDLAGDGSWVHYL